MDPMESQVQAMLLAANEPFDRFHPSAIDFYLPRRDLFIEVKRFYSPRIDVQLGRIPNADAIVIQGLGALPKLAHVILGSI